MVASVPDDTKRTCFTPWYGLSDGLGETDLTLGWRPKGGAAGRSLGYRLQHVWMGMAEMDAPRMDVVEQLPAVDVLHEGSLGTRHEIGRATDRTEGSHGRVDASGITLQASANSSRLRAQRLVGSLGEAYRAGPAPSRRT